MSTVGYESKRLKSNVSNALDAIASKGVSVPSNSNSDDLASLIAKIETVDSSAAMYTHCVKVFYNDGQGTEALLTVYARDTSEEVYNKYSVYDLDENDGVNSSCGWQAFMAKFAQGVIYPASGFLGANTITYVKKVTVSHTVEGTAYTTPAFEAYDAKNALVFTFDVLEDEINGVSSSPGSSEDMADQYADPPKYAVEDVVSTVTAAVPSYERFTITE